MLIQSLNNINRPTTETRVVQSSKKTKCPKWEEKEEFKSFIDRLGIWNKIEKGNGKYLDLVESLQSTGRRNEKEKIELEVRNNEIDPEDENVIDVLIDKMKDWFGKPFIDEATSSWRIFIHLLRKTNEKIGEFILKFETAVANLKCSNVEISPLTLAIHLLEAINVDETKRRNIVSNVKFENNPNVLEDLKKSIKLLEGSLVVSQKNDDESEKPDTTDQAFYGEQSRSRGHENGNSHHYRTSRSRNPNRSGSRNRGNSSNQSGSYNRNKNFNRNGSSRRSGSSSRGENRNCQNCCPQKNSEEPQDN